MMDSLKKANALFLILVVGLGCVPEEKEIPTKKPAAVHKLGPFASLQEARDAVRALKAKGPLTKPVRVLIENGTHAMTEPVVFTPDDSGTEACPITYEPAPGAKPVFTGGRVITGFKPGKDGLWTAHVPDVKAGKWYFEQLWVNGKRAVRARSPNKFYHYMLYKVEYGIDPVTGKRENLANRAFIARRKDIEPLKSVPKERWSDITLVAYHSWAVSRHRVQDIDFKTNRVLLTGPAPWPLMRWKPNQRYHLENFRAALDQPGEWFLDRDGTLTYKPRPGEDMTKAEVVAPVCEKFLHFAGEPHLGLWVEHIRLKGLTFRYGQYILPPEGHGDAQAAVRIPAVIMADGARKIVIKGCEVGHVGTYGIWFRQGCRDCLVQRCTIHDLGAGCVKIGEGWRNNNPNPCEMTRHITVDNNILRNGGHLYMGCVGLWIGHSSDNAATHNDIGDFRYSGVSVGWKWGYGKSPAERNKINYNHIHHIGWGVLSDMGGIYTLGESPGTTLSNNVIHDVYSYDHYGRGGWGLYNDAASRFIVMENNLVYNTKTGGYHMHFGKDLISRNNIFAFSMDGQLQFSRKEDHHQFTFERNIVLRGEGGGLLFYRNRTGKTNILRNNLYWDMAGQPLEFCGMTFEEWRKKTGQGKGSIVADPKFVDAKHYDFHLKPGSPAFKIGFKPFDYSKAGVYGDPAWVKKASEVKYPPVEFAPDPPPPPPMLIDEDFETMPAGSPPPVAKMYAEKRKGLLGVTDETAASGTQSLKIADAPDLKASYNPHFYYQPHYSEGVSTCSFDIRIEKGTKMYHEWREYPEGKKYIVGPSLTIGNGDLFVGGKKLAKLPVGKWVHVEVVAGQGAKANGTWTLTVTLPGQKPSTFAKLKTGRPEWKVLDWCGFSSTASEKTCYYLDNIKLTNTAAKAQAEGE
ncbi:MAG: right-handed parallel beta-helix repeat-containing protein [Planctomycetes bacterium]|nr:right-handed parallel beta-helix repeat-containing protein [Planctomycetota bacterium]